MQLVYSVREIAIVFFPYFTVRENAGGTVHGFCFSMVNVSSVTSLNRPRSTYQYSNMAPRLSGKNCKFFKFILSLNSQKRLGYKENNTKYRSLT